MTGSMAGGTMWGAGQQVSLASTAPPPGAPPKKGLRKTRRGPSSVGCQCCRWCKRQQRVRFGAREIGTAAVRAMYVRGGDKAMKPAGHDRAARSAQLK